MYAVLHYLLQARNPADYINEMGGFAWSRRRAGVLKRHTGGRSDPSSSAPAANEWCDRVVTPASPTRNCVMRCRLSLVPCAIAIVMAAAAPAAAQVYKWTDDKGVVNYSNTPPEKRGGKGVSVVEDRVSTYTPDAALQQATQNARDRRNLPPAPEPRPAVTIAPVPAAAPSITTSTTDPCVNADPAFDCYGYYAGVPVIGGRRRPPRFNQPQLPAGAIAGNVNAGGGFTPGLSTQALLGAPAPRVERRRVQSAPAREPDRR
jgi:hypothetical protein